MARALTIPRIREIDPFDSSTVRVIGLETVHCSSIPWNQRPYAALTFVTRGNAHIQTAYGSAQLRPGHLVAADANVLAAGKVVEELHMSHVYGDGTIIGNLFSWILPPARQLAPGLHPSQWHRHIAVVELGRQSISRAASLIAELTRPTLSVHDSSNTHRLRLLVTLFDGLKEPFRSVKAPILLGASHSQSNTAATRAEVSTAMKLMQSDLCRYWTLPDLAAEVLLSPSQLLRLFKTDTGTTPMAWLGQARAAEFAHLLVQTDSPISLLARQVGWADSRIAARWLRRHYSLSPAEFRARHQSSSAWRPHTTHTPL